MNESRFPHLEVIEERLGIKAFEYQEKAWRWTFAVRNATPRTVRALLFYKTGAGKTYTAAGMLHQLGYDKAVVIAPPSTHESWKSVMAKLDIETELISHAKFRQKGYRLSRTTPVIADEFHLFGKNTGAGYVKLQKLADHLDAPIILNSATPNYNDAERCYCIMRILDPQNFKGGIMDFIARYCETEPNFFGIMPIVTGFRNHKDAADFLSSQPCVFYVEDDVDYSIIEEHIQLGTPQAFSEMGLDTRHNFERIMASQMEARHRLKRIKLLTVDERRLDPTVATHLHRLLNAAKGKVLIFSASEKIAKAAAYSLSIGWRVLTVTGRDNTASKTSTIRAFIKDPDAQVLVGTAALATGTDGLDRVCDTLIILDDTDDDAMRRQLIGRIMPRGANAQKAKDKRVYRVNV